jgi:hypothetical protein
MEESDLDDAGLSTFAMNSTAQHHTHKQRREGHTLRPGHTEGKSVETRGAVA